MTRLVLVRHGETDWNAAGRWQGKTDVPLKERGREQAAGLGGQAKILQNHPDGTVVVVSPGFVLSLLHAHLLGEPVEKAWERIPANGR